MFAKTSKYQQKSIELNDKCYYLTMRNKALESENKTMEHRTSVLEATEHQLEKANLRIEEMVRELQIHQENLAA